MGLLAGRFAAEEYHGRKFTAPPQTTALGALYHHITGDAEADTFQPMNVNFGLFPPPQPPEGKRKIKGRDRKLAITERAKTALKDWMQEQGID